MVNYTYNAWGEIISTTGNLASTIGSVNKLRYRSYYYDDETGFYYLQSRYYDPIVKRFISPDSTDYLTENGDFDGYNLYAYCVNNPVNNADSSGAISVKAIAAVIAGIVAYSLRLSVSMYLYAVSGAHFASNRNFSSWYDPIGQMMRSRLMDSKHLKKSINKSIKNKKWSGTYSMNFGNDDGNLADVDLFLSLGKININYKIKKTSKKKFIFFGKTKYVITLSMSDKYDFAYMKKGESNEVVRFINNKFGYKLQQKEILKVYNWSMSFSYDYYY